MATYIVLPDTILNINQIREEFWNLPLLIKAFTSVHECLVWCAMRQLIRNTVLCNVCNIHKTLVKRTGRIDEYMWKCRQCKMSTSVRDGSFFARSHLAISQIIIIIYGFANDFPQKIICREASLAASSVTVVDWCNFCREVCTTYLQQHPVELGGFDENGEPLTVEMGESYFFHRKYHRGAFRNGQWVFGMVERNSGKLFLTPVQARNEETLLPIVSRTILPGTVIVTDGWGAYKNIGLLDGGVYEHRTVIHQHQNNFVDPDDSSVHTQTILSVWNRAKKLCRQCGTSTDLFPSYLQEFMWRERIRNKEPFVEFLLCIVEQYLV
ncbi:uncharacterized protein LOC126888463 [Diabrotica virgifera virgifera]|uniref:ISXO2-like transposase domain-containing protein n=1 Tax=Diabrotica virgifera virgifera TaxID=50390 RepID=A0ABM5KRD7_DIAVI|nr:uncharacterized protein LOC126888463 [Diabrotica virgifera virgifera]